MSSKTPIKPEEKTELAHKGRNYRPLASLILGAVMLFAGGWLLWSGISRVTDNKQLLITPNGRIDIEVADEADERYLGLSGRIGINGGLLFEYEDSSIDHCLVMRDMLFTIDMVWLDSEKNVVTVTPSVSPETYPEVFCPEKPAKYALELEGGEAERLEITPGARLVY